MARQAGTVLNNNFSKGLITEATGLNFPDNAVTETWNNVFERIGSVIRRRGFDLEGSATTFVYDESDGILREFVWQSVALNGGFTFLVLQVGESVLFYELSSNSSLSAGQIPVGLDLKSYKAPGSAIDIRTTPASFASGAGYLFICHPACEPLVMYYDDEKNGFFVSPLNILVRDYEGVEDGVGLAEEPKDLTAAHNYNLFNQGWYKSVRVGQRSTGGDGGGGSGEGLGVFGQFFLYMKQLEAIKGGS